MELYKIIYINVSHAEKFLHGYFRYIKKKQEVTQKLTDKATKFGVDINGLSNKDAKEKIKEVNQAVKANKTTGGTV